MASKVDMNDPQVKRLVYNMYRGMLGNYNDKANDLIGTLPKDRVKADQGIHRQIESMIRQSSQISGGGSPSPGGGVADGPPVNAAPSFPAPPPPPPPGPGVLPSVRLSTEIGDRRGKEPPAAIQNAMMSKDKKPFTYTPGGIDLSQIRSPRMARRIERNAAAEGVTEVPKSQPTLSPHPQGPVAGSTPQMAVPVFPPAPPPPPPLGPAMAGAPPIVIPKNPVLRATGLRHDRPDTENAGVPPPPSQPMPTYAPPSQPMPTYAPPSQQSKPNYAPPSQQPMPTYAPPSQQPMPTYAPPMPTMVQRQPLHEVPVQHNQPTNNQYNQRQLSNEAPMSPPPQPGSIYVPPVTSRAQVGSLYIPPINDAQDARDNGRQTPLMSPPPTTPLISPVQLAKAPTPWMSKQQVAPQVPAWAARDESAAPAAAGGTRIIPIQVEGREPPQPQQKQPQYQQQQQQQQQYQQQLQQQQYQQQQQQQQQYQQQQYQQQQQQQQQYQQQQQMLQQQRQQQQSPGTRVIPIQIEATNVPVQSYQQQQQQQQQQASSRQRVMQPVYVHNKFNPTSPPPQGTYPQNDNAVENSRQLQQQQSWSGAPVQSRSFKVLQKITDTDKQEEEVVPEVGQEYQPAGGQWGGQQQQQQGNQWGQQNTQGVPLNQLRKLELNEDDRALMNKFKAQVDEDSSLHTEADPRYRGAAIPSRAFRMLQTMTDTAGENTQPQQVPRGPTPGGQSRVQQVQADQPPQPYIPASEQQVQEPRKYTGGAIPSRSFRMLQAMTAPENCAPGQSDM